MASGRAAAAAAMVAVGGARDARARSPRAKRDLMFGGAADQGADILLVTRGHHAQRPHLEETGVGAVKRPRDVVKENVPANDPFEVIANAALIGDRLSAF